MTLPATTLDTFRPSKRVTQSMMPAHPAASSLFVRQSDEFGTRQRRKDKQFLEHFTYWNYVAIKRKADKFAEPFPQIGVKRDAGRNPRRKQKRFLSHSDRRWLKQSYGSRWIQSVDDDIEPLPEDHILVDLLARVNGDDCWQEFAFETCIMWELTAKFYWLVIPDQFGVPFELWVIPTPWVRPVYSKSGELTKWIVEPPGNVKPFEFPPDWILEGKFKSPISKREGWGALHAGPKWVDTVEAIADSRYHHFKTGINPDVMLIFENERWKNPKKDELTRIEEKFLNRIAGTHNSGKPLMIPPGVNAEKWSNSPKEMDYSNTEPQARDNNLALHGVSKTIAGFNDDVNRATFEGSLAWFCNFTMNPLFRLFAGILTEKLASRFDPRIRIWYPDCTPEDSKNELERDKADFEMGAIDPDEIRTKRGREPKGGPMYETGYIGSGRIPLNEGLQPEPEPDPEPGDETAGKQDPANVDEGDGNENPD